MVIHVKRRCQVHGIETTVITAIVINEIHQSRMKMLQKVDMIGHGVTESVLAEENAIQDGSIWPLRR